MGRFFIQVFFGSLTLIGGIAVVLFFYPQLRRLPADLLVHKDQVAPGADAVILLMGGVADRTPYCGNLIKRGVAPRIVFVESEQDDLGRLGLRKPDGETTRRYLLKLGVSEQQIIFNSKTAATSTAEEIAADFKLIAEKLPHAKRLILCTSWYHSSRALWITQKINADRYTIESLPTHQPKIWYGKEFDFLMVFNEYLKWTYYLLHY